MMIWCLMIFVCEKEMYLWFAGGRGRDECERFRGREKSGLPEKEREIFLSVLGFQFTSRSTLVPSPCSYDGTEACGNWVFTRIELKFRPSSFLSKFQSFCLNW